MKSIPDHITLSIFYLQEPTEEKRELPTAQVYFLYIENVLLYFTHNTSLRITLL
jgi:hypothetical protein